MKSLGYVLVHTLMFCAVMGSYGPTAVAQTGEATVVVNVIGLNADVSLYLMRTGGTQWSLGLASFVFNFNNGPLTYSSLLNNGVWSGGSFYGTSFSAAYPPTGRSMEIEFNGGPGQGTDVPTVPTLIGTLRFTISDVNASHNITWDPTSSFVSDDGGGDVTGGITWTNPLNGGLPITLSSFTAAAVNQNSVRLDWSTATETNNYGFEVQKSAGNQNSYQTISNSFIAGHGTTIEPHSYSFVDNSVAPGQWYYRLKQSDFDGTVHFSDGVQVDVVTGVGDKPLPKVFALDQNYPNPFNPSTKIEYAVPKSSHVLLEVYNVIGQKVATLVNETKSAGYYNATFDASRFASGLYFYSMKAGEVSFLKKMMLVK